jgi:hypothetical protein
MACRGFTYGHSRAAAWCRTWSPVTNSCRSQIPQSDRRFGSCHHPASGDHSAAYFASAALTTGTSTAAGATRPAFQASNDSFTSAFPSPAPSGTWTRSSRQLPQHRRLSTVRAVRRGPPALAGKAMSATG